MLPPEKMNHSFVSGVVPWTAVIHLVFTEGFDRRASRFSDGY
jgi:hypothetical protein